jgi:hypothetical protein
VLPDDSREDGKAGWFPCKGCLEGRGPFGSEEQKRLAHCAFRDPSTWEGSARPKEFGGPDGTPEHTPWGLLETESDPMPCPGYVRHLPVVCDAFELRASPELVADPPATLVEAKAVLNRAFSNYDVVQLRKSQRR